MRQVLGGPARKSFLGKNIGGYTILEVMLFLAISALLLGGAITAVGGINNQTQFSQSMRDINSELQAWMGNVTNGFPGSSPVGSYQCSLVSNRPHIVKSTGTTTTPECIFLGKALQFTTDSGSLADQSHQIFAYSVFGRRALPNGQLVSSLLDASPIAATARDGSGTINLTQTFNMNGGVKLVSIKSFIGATYPGSATGQPYHLIGFYNGVSTASASSSNGNSDLNTFAYPLAINYPPSAAPGTNATVQDCIELVKPGPCALTGVSNPPALDQYILCFGNDNDNETASLTITSYGGLGAQTDLSFGACS